MIKDIKYVTEHPLLVVKTLMNLESTKKNSKSNCNYIIAIS